MENVSTLQITDQCVLPAPFDSKCRIMMRIEKLNRSYHSNNGTILFALRLAEMSMTWTSDVTEVVRSMTH